MLHPERWKPPPRPLHVRDHLACRTRTAEAARPLRWPVLAAPSPPGRIVVVSTSLAIELELRKPRANFRPDCFSPIGPQHLNGTCSPSVRTSGLDISRCLTRSEGAHELHWPSRGVFRPAATQPSRLHPRGLRESAWGTGTGALRPASASSSGPLRLKRRPSPPGPASPSQPAGSGEPPAKDQAIQRKLLWDNALAVRASSRRRIMTNAKGSLLYAELFRSPLLVRGPIITASQSTLPRMER